MLFKLSSSPHVRAKLRTPQLMRLVIYCLIPGIAAQWYFFGWGNLIQIALACFTALLCEGLYYKVRKRPAIPYLSDCSALLTAVLIGVSLPPMAPWWLVVMGTAFAIIIAKNLYGGMGQNLFNPAMVAYVLLLISFPVQMTSWLPPAPLMLHENSLLDAIYSIFTGYSFDGYSVHQLREGIDGATMATPLDQLKTGLTLGLTSSEIMKQDIYSFLSGVGVEWVNIGFLIGGLILLKRRAISWHIPVSFLVALFFYSLVGFMLHPDGTGSPLLHLFSGATMLGAFFILTDPVTASTTVKGRLVYGALVAFLVYCIRTWGGYPDAVAFAVLMGNMCVPLIDYYTQPKVYGRSQN